MFSLTVISTLFPFYRFVLLSYFCTFLSFCGRCPIKCTVTVEILYLWWAVSNLKLDKAVARWSDVYKIADVVPCQLLKSLFYGSSLQKPALLGQWTRSWYICTNLTGSSLESSSRVFELRSGSCFMFGFILAHFNGTAFTLALFLLCCFTLACYSYAFIFSLMCWTHSIWWHWGPLEW